VRSCFRFSQHFELRIGGKTRRFQASDWARGDFDGRWPVGRVDYRDPSCPLDATLEAWSPFIPLHLADSMQHKKISEMAFPLVVYTKDGWIEIFRSKEGLMMWGKGALKRHMKIGLYFLDSEGVAWVASEYEIIEKPTLKETVAMLRMFLPPIFTVDISVSQVQGEGIALFKELIEDRPPNKRVRFGTKELESVREARTIRDLVNALQSSGVPMS
jgi:hypothetical protein